MALIDVPQAKWSGGTGRQVILKGDFAKIEAALVEGFELAGAPSLEYVSVSQVRVNATADVKARVMLTGFPSPLHRGLWVGAGLTDGRYRENAAPATLDLGAAGSRWGSEKASQWYSVYALAGATDTIFTLKAMPVMRVGSQAGQVITLRNNANTSGIGYGFAADELKDGKILMLTGASRGLVRVIFANNSDNGTGGSLTYGGSALTLAPGDWFVVLPKANFRYLGMVLNDAASNLAPFYQDGRSFTYQSSRDLAEGAINGFTLFDLALAAPPTARALSGLASAANGADVKLAVSYDGTSAALMLHSAAPAAAFQGVRGALAFACRVPETRNLYMNNENAANQAVKITGWQE